MSAEDLIENFSETVTVNRESAGTYSSGVYVPGSSSLFAIQMSVQPLSGKELLNLPEAQRTRRQIKGYTATELFTASEALSQKADIVSYDDSTFEVQDVEQWEGSSNALNFWKVRMAEVNL